MAVTSLCKSVNYLKIIPNGLISPCIMAAAVNFQSVRCGSTKHYNPKFKKLRKLKFIKVDLPNFEEKVDELSPEEMKIRLKERGLMPTRPWNERQFFISCTGGVFEPYIPPEGDGKISVITMPGAKQKLELLEKKGKSMLAIRKIRSFDEEFQTSVFAENAQEIYIKAHKYMSENDDDKLLEVVTERAYPEIKDNSEKKTIHWKFIKSLEPPRVVHVRYTDLISKENLFAQITVRFHTQQVLAIYDRFGRLMHGSEIVAKDVLEYVVLEKHLSNQYGAWRIHSKIIPNWMPPRDAIEKTFVKPEETIEVEPEPEQPDNSPKEDLNKIFVRIAKRVCGDKQRAPDKDCLQLVKWWEFAYTKSNWSLHSVHLGRWEEPGDTV